MTFNHTPARRIVQHDNEHYDIEERYTIEDENRKIVTGWAVVECNQTGEERMNGLTPTIPLKTRLENLIGQIPQQFRFRAVAECQKGAAAEVETPNDSDIERHLSTYVLHRVWETYPVAAEEAWQAEQEHPAVSHNPYTDAWVDELPPSPFRVNARLTYTLDGEFWIDGNGNKITNEQMVSIYASWKNPSKSDIGKYKKESPSWRGDLDTLF